MSQDPADSDSTIPAVPADSWIIGDVHGCHDTLMELLKQIDDGQPAGHLVFIGDLVGKGPESLGVIQFMLENSARVSVTLGNHDLHLLACRKGVSTPRASDRIQALLGLPEGHPWETWLSQQPYAIDLHIRKQENSAYRMIHAGIHPEWSQSDLRSRLKLLHSKTRANSWDWYKNHQSQEWKTASILTRIRCLKRLNCEPDSDFTEHPGTAPEELAPWFDLLHKEDRHPAYVFGHWARLGLHESPMAICLDSGCVYGGRLTAYQPSSGVILYQENCERSQ